MRSSAAAQDFWDRVLAPGLTGICMLGGIG